MKILVLVLTIVLFLSGCALESNQGIKKEITIIENSKEYWLNPSDEQANNFCLELCDDKALEKYVNNGYLTIFECCCLNEDCRYIDYRNGNELSEEQLEERIEDWNP